MASFRFLHAADIHLDSPLKGLAGQDGNAAERVRTATREALDQLVSLTIEEQVDFLIIAGDLYDGDWRDYKTGLFFAGQMGRLNASNVPVYLLHGNHDAESQITRRLDLPDNVDVFGTRKPETFALEHLVALHGQSFRQRDVTENLVPDYPAPVSGAFNIGVLHTGLGGMGGHANHAPCSFDDLANKGYDFPGAPDAALPSDNATVEFQIGFSVGFSTALLSLCGSRLTNVVSTDWNTSDPWTGPASAPSP